MLGDLWGVWLAHVPKDGPSWLYPVLFFTHALCLRISEALRLTGKDFNWATGMVLVAAMKAQPEWKQMLAALRPKIEQLRQNGIRIKRDCNAGARGRDTSDGRLVLEQ